MVRALTAGLWAPIPTFFLPDESLDIPTFTEHVVYLAKANVWPVISGSMGEAHHLNQTERVTLIKEARKALDAAGLESTPIMAGTGLGSTRATIEVTKEAAEAGADSAIIIASGYYAGALTKEALVKFFVDVAEASPIPIIVYNYPGASGGIDLSSDDILAMANASSNISGVKLTCGGVGKLTRITSGTTSKEFVEKNGTFVTLGGFADFILPSVVGAQAHGAIMGLANLYPRSISALYQKSLALLEPSSPTWAADHAEALRLQALVSEADSIYAPLGIAGTKATLQHRRGYGGVPRLPLLPFDAKKLAATEAIDRVKAVNAEETKLENAAASTTNGVH